METQAYFDNIQSEIHRRLSAAEREIDLAVAWLTDRVLFDVIADYLQHGKPYHPQHTVGGEKHHIRAVIDRLRSRRAQLRAALQALRTHDTFNTLQHINDWNTYFDNQKAALQARLDKLNEEWTRINK
jgi:uncharacterized protein YukE